MQSQKSGFLIKFPAMIAPVQETPEKHPHKGKNEQESTDIGVVERGEPGELVVAQADEAPSEEKDVAPQNCKHRKNPHPQLSSI